MRSRAERVLAVPSAAPARLLAEIDSQNSQSFMALQSKRITAAPTAAQINGTIDPAAGSLRNEAMWNPMNDPATPTSALVT